MAPFPPIPPLGELRLAMPSDLFRIGIVAAAAFRYSPLFRWERPYHQQYPEDTLLSYRTQFKTAMQSDEFAVLVVEDAYKPDEDSATKAIIPPDNGWKAPAENTTVVVGVASIKLEPGSKRRDQFKSPNASEIPVLPNNPGRDLNRKHYDAWGSKVGTAKKKYRPMGSSMTMVAVHPAYWKKGHGSRLVEWSKSLSDFDAVDQSASAAYMGVRLYSKLGYKFVTRIAEKGDDDDPEGVYTDLLEYQPQAGSMESLKGWQTESRWHVASSYAH